MSLIATDAQTQELDNYVELFEIILSNSTTLYFHAGVDSSLDALEFRDYDSPYTVRTYTALPIIIEGIEVNGDGAQNRPTLTVANVASTFRDLLGVSSLTNDSLIGKRIVRRQTLAKYLVGGSGDASPPVEFPRKVYVIDRISGENSIAVTFELASPFDVTGVMLPNRIVTGKYCSWLYQSGGCIWATNSTIYYRNTSGVAVAHKAYFNSDDEPIVPSTAISGAYAGGTTYAKGDLVSYSSNYWRSEADSNTGNTPSTSSIYWTKVRIYTVWSGSSVAYTASSGDPASSSCVEYSNTIWRCTKSHTSTVSIIPQIGSLYWIRGDVCGKAISSCKARFQFRPVDPDTANSTPYPDLETSKQLPFGGFPGTSKFR